MAETDLEGTLVLERLAEVGTVEEFAAAVDADDFARAAELMRSAQIDAGTIELVLKKMSDAES